MKKKIIDFNPFFLKIINLNSRLEFIFNKFKNIIFSNSLSYEDIFLFHFINLKKIKLFSFFLNTGKISLNFLNLLNKLNFKFLENKILNFYPNLFLVNKYIKKYNFNSFYNNIILRKFCCYIRKIEPYNKAVFNKEILIVGKRNNRINNKNFIEYDYSRNIIKYNFLMNWDYKDIFYFTEKFNIINNYAYDYGYSSIGCSSCTKKINYYNYSREGRWWWEEYSKKECGLHF